MPRIKSYSAQSGYAYQYVFTGTEKSHGQIVYLFEASHDRSEHFLVQIILPASAVLACDRALTPTEQYAVAKMALFEAFDDRQFPADLRLPVTVTEGQALQIFRTLDL